MKNLILIVIKFLFIWVFLALLGTFIIFQDVGQIKNIIDDGYLNINFDDTAQDKICKNASIEIIDNDNYICSSWIEGKGFNYNSKTKCSCYNRVDRIIFFQNGTVIDNTSAYNFSKSLRVQNEWNRCFGCLDGRDPNSNNTFFMGFNKNCPCQDSYTFAKGKASCADQTIYKSNNTPINFSFIDSDFVNEQPNRIYVNANGFVSINSTSAVFCDTKLEREDVYAGWLQNIPKYSNKEIFYKTYYNNNSNCIEDVSAALPETNKITCCKENFICTIFETLVERNCICDKK